MENTSIIDVSLGAQPKDRIGNIKGRKKNWAFSPFQWPRTYGNPKGIHAIYDVACKRIPKFNPTVIPL